MKKYIALAAVPVILAVTPALSLAEKAMPHGQQGMKQTQTTQMTRTESRTQKGMQQQGQQQWGNTWQTGSQGSMNPQVVRQILMGQENLIDRRYPEAISAFQTVINTEPNNVRALDGLATALYSQGRFDEAMQMVNRGIALDPMSSRLFWTKGQILDAQDRPLEAVESYLTFTSLNPEDTNAIWTLRRVDELQKRVQNQLTESWQSYLQGLRYLSLRQPEQAIPQFERFQTLEPNNEKATQLLGRSWLAMGLPDKAIPHFQTSLRLQADNPVVYYQLGSSYDLRGETQQARDAWRKFIQYAPQSESAMLINRRFELRPQ